MNSWPRSEACEILRTIFQPRALSSDIPASQEGVYLVYTPPHYFLYIFYCGKEKTFSEGNSTFAANQIQAG